MSGASDVLSALGVKLDVPVEDLALRGGGRRRLPVGAAASPGHKHWAPIRAELGIRTIFNLLGPISNPAGVKRQVVGVFSWHWVEPIAQVLNNLGAEHVWVVHGHDGLDELTTTGPTTSPSLPAAQVRTFEVDPRDVGIRPATLADLKGGDARANADALRAVLAGAPSAYRDIVLLNTGAGLACRRRRDRSCRRRRACGCLHRQRGGGGGARPSHRPYQRLILMRAGLLVAFALLMLCRDYGSAGKCRELRSTNLPLPRRPARCRVRW